MDEAVSAARTPSFVDIAGRTIRRGQRQHIVLEAAGTLTGSTLVPATVLAGGAVGPTVAIAAACHPGEYTGILSVIEIGRRIDPNLLCGNLVLVPVQNPYGVQAKSSYTSPIDTVDMGTAYRIGERLPQTQTLSHYIAREIFRSVIDGADAFIDLHGGELFESHCPSASYYVCGDNAVDQRARTLALATRLPLIWEVRPGSIAELPGYPGRGSARMEAAIRGVPAIAVSAGGQGRLDRHAVDSCVDAILGILHHLNMIKIDIPPPSMSETLLGGHVIFARRAGLLDSTATPGTLVHAGEPIGRTIDLRGEEIESHRSPQAGRLLNAVTRGVVSPGDMLYLIGNLVDEASTLGQSGHFSGE